MIPLTRLAWAALLIAGVGTDDDPLARAPGTTFRILSWNINRVAHVAHQSDFRTMMRAIDPDVLLLSEVAETTSVADVYAALRGLRDPTDTAWQITFGRGGGYQRGVVAARAPVTAVPELDSIPYPADAVADLVARMSDTAAQRQMRANLAEAVGAHGGVVRVKGRFLLAVVSDFQCCGTAGGWEEQRRRREAAVIRDAVRAAVRRVPVDAVVLGADLNLVTGGAPLDSLLRPIDRQHGSFTATAPKHVAGALDWTWDGRGTPFPSSRLDYVLYSARTLLVLRSFVFDTEDLNPEQLARHGLGAGTSARLSDHRPVVVDFTWVP